MARKAPPRAASKTTTTTKAQVQAPPVRDSNEGHAGRHRSTRTAVAVVIPTKRAQPPEPTLVLPPRRVKKTKLSPSHVPTLESPLASEEMPAPAPAPAKRVRTARSGRAQHAVSPAFAAPVPPASPRRSSRALKSSNGVAGSPRVTKRVARGPKQTVPALTPPPSTGPRLRSRLRARVPKKEAEVPLPAPASRSAAPKGRTRPARNAPAPVSNSKKPAQPKKSANKGTTQPKKPAKKAARDAVAKPAAVRRRRGFITLEVPKKFVAQIQQYLLNLQAEDNAQIAVAASNPVDDADMESVGGVNYRTSNSIIELEADDSDVEEGAQEVLNHSVEEPSGVREGQPMIDIITAEQDIGHGPVKEPVEELEEEVVGEIVEELEEEIADQHVEEPEGEVIDQQLEVRKELSMLDPANANQEPGEAVEKLVIEEQVNLMGFGNPSTAVSDHIPPIMGEVFSRDNFSVGAPDTAISQHTTTV